MKLQAIRYFIAVVECGGFRSAAKAMPISQSAMTAALQQLEDELGAPLLFRTKKGVIPTQFGRAFLERARAIEQESRKAREEIAQLRGHWEGTVAFATSPAFGIGIIPAVVREFRERFPSIRLRCVDGLYPGTLAGLRDRSLDFAIGPCDLDHLEPPFVAEPLLPGDVVIVCRRDHPSRTAGALAELSECEWAISSGPGSVGAFIEQAFRASGLDGLKVGMICESFMALPGVIAMSDMLGTLPRAVFENSRWRDQLAIIPMREPLPAPTIAILRRGDIPLTPAAGELIGWIRHYSAKLGRSDGRNSP